MTTQEFCAVCCKPVDPNDGYTLWRTEGIQGTRQRIRDVVHGKCLPDNAVRVSPFGFELKSKGD